MWLNQPFEYFSDWLARHRQDRSNRKLSVDLIFIENGLISFGSLDLSTIRFSSLSFVNLKQSYIYSGFDYVCLIPQIFRNIWSGNTERCHGFHILYDTGYFTDVYILISSFVYNSQFLLCFKSNNSNLLWQETTDSFLSSKLILDGKGTQKTREFVENDILSSLF